MLEISLDSNCLKLLNVVSVEAVECSIRKEMEAGWWRLEISGKHYLRHYVVGTNTLNSLNVRNVG